MHMMFLNCSELKNKTKLQWFTSDNLGLPRMPDLLHAKSDVTLKTNLSGQESDSVSESRVA